ncbi:MAG: V-type ATP synthase subunit E [Candidatus Micrarchaeia archaeon]
MGIGHLTADILAEARKEAKAITDEAEAEKKKVIKEARQKAKERLAAAEKSADEFVEAQRRERVAWAKLEAKKMEGEARETVISEAMDGLYKKLSGFRKDKRYPGFLKERVQEAMDEIQVDNHTVHVCKGDKSYLKGIKATIKEDLSGMGGAIVVSPNGNVRVDCTLSSLFEEKREVLRKKLYERLFG